MIKSGRSIYFLCQNMRHNKNKHSAWVWCSACNAFIFGYGMAFYFIMQSSFEKISKNSPFFLSQRGNPPSALILFILTAAASHSKNKILRNCRYDNAFVCKSQLYLSFCFFMQRSITMASTDVTKRYFR